MISPLKKKQQTGRDSSETGHQKKRKNKKFIFIRRKIFSIKKDVISKILKQIITMVLSKMNQSFQEKKNDKTQAN